MWDTVDGESERLRSSTEEEETVWRLTRSSARVPIFPRSSLVRLLLCPATIPHLTLRPAAARRRCRSSTESPTGRPHNDNFPRARLHARPVSLFATSWVAARDALRVHTTVMHTSLNIQAVNRSQSRPTNLCQKLGIIYIYVIASVKGWRVRLLVESPEGIGVLLIDDLRCLNMRADSARKHLAAT
jgi:hypothetical protein